MGLRDQWRQKKQQEFSRFFFVFEYRPKLNDILVIKKPFILKSKNPIKLKKGKILLVRKVAKNGNICVSNQDGKKKRWITAKHFINIEKQEEEEEEEEAAVWWFFFLTKSILDESLNFDTKQSNLVSPIAMHKLFCIYMITMEFLFFSVQNKLLKKNKGWYMRSHSGTLCKITKYCVASHSKICVFVVEKFQKCTTRPFLHMFRKICSSFFEEKKG